MGRSGDAIFRRVLVPTDFSPDSEQALVLAQRVAAALDSELTLLHVLPVTPLDVDREAASRTAAAAHQLGILRADQLPATHERTFEGPFTSETLRDFSPAGQAWARRLQGLADHVGAQGVKTRAMLRVGEPYREIVAVTETAEIGLVILALHGHGRIHHLLAGGVADRVIRMARCPVLTVNLLDRTAETAHPASG